MNKLKSDLNSFKACIFDMDGTLVDSMWMWAQIDKDYLGKFGIEVPERLQNDIEGKSFNETALYFKQRFSLEDSIETIKKTWNDMAIEFYQTKVPFKDGAYDFLLNCKSKNMMIGVATSNSRELVNALFLSLNIADLIDCVMTSSDVSKGKPAPDVYLAVAQALNIPVEKCLVFEDIMPGITAGKSAGMKVCAVDDAYSHDIVEIKKKASDYFIDSYCELL